MGDHSQAILARLEPNEHQGSLAHSSLSVMDVACLGYMGMLLPRRPRYGWLQEANRRPLCGVFAAGFGPKYQVLPSRRFRATETPENRNIWMRNGWETAG